MSLAERLRDATRELHAQAERSGVMLTLLRGELGRGDYALLLRNLHAIYSELEAALAQHGGHPVLAPAEDPALRRRAALEADLALLAGADWPSALPLAPAGRDYARRLQHCAAAEPPLLLAHAYVRYLGDLSGGQLLQGIVARSLRLADGRGTAFYRFEARDARELATRFRAGLDAARLDAGAADAIVDEARWAFAAHVRLFEELVP